MLTTAQIEDSLERCVLSLKEEEGAGVSNCDEVAEDWEETADVKDYLVQVLQDDDAYEDLESLQQTIQPSLAQLKGNGSGDGDNEDGDHDKKLAAAAKLLVETLAGMVRKPSHNQEQHELLPREKVTPIDGSGENEEPALRVLDEPSSLRGKSTLSTVTSLDQNNDSKASATSQETASTPANNNKKKKQSAKDRRRQQHHQQQRGQQSTTGPGAANKFVEKDQEDGKNTTSTVPTNKDANLGNRGHSGEEDDLLEDEASAWKDCLDSGQAWGGRGKGGRGAYAGKVNSTKSNIHLVNVSLQMLGGTGELLQNATMDIVRGHKYGLIGRNGVGKSTLLRRLAQKAIPGLPLDMKMVLVQQQIDGSNESSLQVLVNADLERTQLLRERDVLEAKMEQVAAAGGGGGGASTDTSLLLTEADVLSNMAERLGDIEAELEVIGADTAQDRALDILHGLQFTDVMIHGPTHQLSGGWRMRLAMARALMVPSDLLLFDEVTNHLDLHGLDWLIRYLNRNEDKTLIVVSHDRTFLDMVCTDIMVLEHQRLSYHVGSYSEYEQQKQEKAARHAQILDASERQRNKAEAFVQKQQQMANKKSADPNKQRQAKMIKEKKLDRIGNYREDGKRYKNQSLQKLSEDYIRLAEKVTIEVDDPIIKMYFPNPVWPPGVSQFDPIVRLEDFSFDYSSPVSSDKPLLLNNVTVRIDRGSKIAMVGVNGCGKSTLVKLIAGEIDSNASHSKSIRFTSSVDSSSNKVTRGTLWKHPSLRIGHVSQYSVEELEIYKDLTVVEYAEEKLKSGKASAEIVAKASGNVRQYLGAFGLGGKRHALQKIGKLSGGERMRLCFATILAASPHLLILDESTNHVDIETLDSMSEALNNFEGSVVMVSHNQAFLSGFCKELWVLDAGQLAVNHSDTETFDELFSEYRTSVTSGGSSSLSSERQERATMARKATKQRAGARQNTALL